MEISEKQLKTLEFPYGSSSGIVSFRHHQSAESDPEPSLNQPNSDSFEQCLNPAVFRHSRVDGGCHQKGSSHSGFLRIIFKFLRI